MAAEDYQHIGNLPKSPGAGGKGGPKHGYLQVVVKELAEQQGFKATIEAPLADGGQVEVLLEREGLRVEVSVTTPVEQERENVAKCLRAGFKREALVLVKSSVTRNRYRTQIEVGLTDHERERLSFLSPEDLPDYIASLAPPPPPTESIVKGYRVRVSHSSVFPDDTRARRDQIAWVVARSVQQAD